MRNKTVAVFAAMCSVMILSLGSLALPHMADAQRSQASQSLAAVRFVAVSSADDSAKRDVWLDGQKRISGLRDASLVPYLLVGAGAHALQIRVGANVIFESTPDIAPESSVTFLFDFSQSSTRLLRFDDAPNAGLQQRSARFVNMTSATKSLNVGGEVVLVPANEISAFVPLVSNKGSTSFVEVGQRRLSIATKTTGPKLILLRPTGSASQSKIALTVLSALRYPSALLRSGNLASAITPGNHRTSEYWIRRMLSAAVVLLVVAATIATLRSFRVEALESRVRARM